MRWAKVIEPSDLKGSALIAEFGNSSFQFPAVAL